MLTKNLIITVLIFLFLVLQYKLWVKEDGFRETWHLHKTIAQITEENEKLEIRNAMLEEEVKDLKQGRQAIEERARTDLGMIKEGETFYHIIDE